MTNMNPQSLQSRFAQIGARLKVRQVPSRWRQGDRSWINPTNYSLDVRRDGHGEFFVLRVPTHLRESLEVMVAQSALGRGVLGVIDGVPPKGVETAEDAQHRRDFLRKIGYKR